MSIKPTCSYFLQFTGTPSQQSAFAQKLEQSDLQGLFFCGDNNDTGTIFELKAGTVDQITDIQEILDKIMAEFPECTLYVNETNEEPYCPDIRLEYANGHLISRQSGRRFGPGEYEAIKNACTAHMAAVLNCNHNPWRSQWRETRSDKQTRELTCSSCGHVLNMAVQQNIPNFCPVCGKAMTEFGRLQTSLYLGQLLAIANKLDEI